MVKIIRITTETLQGIPSIIFGLFGLLFLQYCSPLGIFPSGGSYDIGDYDPSADHPYYRGGTYGCPGCVQRSFLLALGPGKLRTVFKVVLPSAIPGILSGVVLATGRIVGETAALIYTAGAVAKVPSSLMGSGRTLAVHMYVLSSEGLYMDQAYATAVILLIFVLVLNWVSGFCAKHLSKATNGQ